MKDPSNFSLAALSSQADFHRLIAESVPMHRLCELIGKMNQSTSPVFS